MAHALTSPQPSPRSQPRTTHPLLGAFPLTVMSLAILLVLFTLAMAWIESGESSPHPPSASTPRVVDIQVR